MTTIHFLMAASVVPLAGFAWLLGSLWLSRRRGRQIKRWLREHEGTEWPERPAGRRLLAVKWEDQ